MATKPDTTTGNKGLGGWLLGALGAVVIAIVTAWAQHWIGPPTSSSTADAPSMAPVQEGPTQAGYPSRESAPESRPPAVSATIAADDIEGKWVYAQEKIMSWKILPSVDGYTIERYYDDVLVARGTGRVTGNEFVFELNVVTRDVGNNTYLLLPNKEQGRLRLINGRLTGPTDDTDLSAAIDHNDWDKLTKITLVRP